MPQNNLFPVFDIPSELAEDMQPIRFYHPAPAWDIETGDFVLNGARQIQYGSGYDAWVFWCTKTVLTQRWSHLGYSNNSGIEAEQAFRETNRKAAESVFRRTITEALLADPAGRTIQVRDFKFDWIADSMYVTCQVVGRNGDTATIQGTLKDLI